MPAGLVELDAAAARAQAAHDGGLPADARAGAGPGGRHNSVSAPVSVGLKPSASSLSLASLDSSGSGNHSRDGGPSHDTNCCGNHT